MNRGYESVGYAPRMEQAHNTPANEEVLSVANLENRFPNLVFLRGLDGTEGLIQQILDLDEPDTMALNAAIDAYLRINTGMLEPAEKIGFCNALNTAFEGHTPEGGFASGKLDSLLKYIKDEKW